MNKKKNIVLLIILNVFICITVTSCQSLKVLNATFVNKTSNSVIECIIDEDTDALSKMFCEYIQEEHDLEAECLGLMEFLDGEIISYDAPDDSIQGNSKIDGELVQQSLTGNISNIKTDTGKTYRMYLEYYSVYKDNDQYIGFTNMVFCCEDDYTKEDGYPDESIYVVGEVIK